MLTGRCVACVTVGPGATPPPLRRTGTAEAMRVAAPRRWIRPLLTAAAAVWFAACGPGGDANPADRRADDGGAAAVAEPADTADAARTGEEDGRPVVLVLGNSLAAGYGLESDQAFPALLQQKVDSAGYDYRVVNAGISGETSAGGLRRIDWLLAHPIAVLVLELGANDALRGQDLDATERNLQRIIDTTRARYPDADIVIAGMRAPPNLGPRYTTRFRDLFIELAEQNDAALIPFLLEDVAAVPELNQDDGIHPTAEGQRLLARNVWEVLEDVLEARG